MRQVGDAFPELGPAGPDAIPELPPLPQPPVQARVMVETLRRDRASLDARLARLRTERDEATAQDPQQLRADLEEAEAARAAAEQAAAGAEERARAAAEERDLAATAERAAASAEAEINKAWRDASTELDRLRETYEDDDRLRGDIERRVRDAERLLREGHGLEERDHTRVGVEGSDDHFTSAFAGRASRTLPAPPSPARAQGRGNP